MKLFIGLLVATVALNGVLSLPALNPSDDAEVIGYPRRVSTRTETEDGDDFNDFKGVIDTGSGYPFLQPNPSILNFGFFDSFDDLFRRFRTRLWPVTVLGRGGEDSDEDSGSGSFGIATNFDPKKANTTSTVKVVDGHKVEVNETVYGDEHSVFKVRVVNVRPLEEGETVEETVKTSSNSDQKPNAKPVTSRPETSSNSDEDDDEGRREPLAKKSKDNEIQGNIDDPEHLSVTENIVEATTTTTATIKDDEDNDDIMLPTTNTEDLAFVTENILAAQVEADELNDNGNGNNEFETNMSSMGNGGENAADMRYNDDAIATATDNAVAIENNEDTEEVNDNLNESSSTSDVAASDSDGNADDDDDDADDDGAQAVAANNEFNDVEDAEDGDDVDDNASVRGKIIKSNVKHSNYAVIRNKQREDATSSDEDDDDDRAAVEMHPTFNDEWGTFNENIDNKENNDLSNDIDVYDVVPIDLSNDIAVNDAANLPINPDAELLYNIDGEQTLHQMPKFEKLSLSDASADNSEHLSSFSGEMK